MKAIQKIVMQNTIMLKQLRTVSYTHLAKLDSLFADFLLFIKITEKLMHAHKQAEKEIENFSWEDLK